jgi:pantoate--beta-alanine ligase
VELIKDINRMRTYIERIEEGKIIGFVPTMGGLHKGHLSLIRKGRGDSDVLVVSIFVNPTQFGPQEDFESYPRDLERDVKLCKQEEVDVVFAPSREEMYSDDYSTFVEVEGYLTSTLEGDSRPGHFRGVTTILTKLFNIVSPDRSYFGEKDYQQHLVVKKLVRELNLNMEIVTLPTVREEDGLALSSRNSYLTRHERKAATILYRSLLRAKEDTLQGIRDTKAIISHIKDLIRGEPLAHIDYVAIVDSATLKTIEEIEKEALVLLAVKIGGHRLIDNMRIRPL